MTDKVESFGQAVDERIKIELPVALEKIEAGFPAPNSGYVEGSLDVNEFLVHHPNSTFIYCVHGESMVEAGIMPGDFVLVDTSLEVKDRDIVVAAVDGEYTIKELRVGPPPKLVPRNRAFCEIEVSEYTEVKIIGPVISVVRRYA